MTTKLNNGSPEAAAAERERSKQAREQIQDFFRGMEGGSMSESEKWLTIERDHKALFERAFPNPTERDLLCGRVSKHGGTQREVAESLVSDVARDLQKRDPELTDAQAVAKALVETDEGRRAWRMMRSRLADAPIADAIRKAGHHERFGKPGDALAGAAEAISKRRGIDYGTALSAAAAEYPELYELWRRGDRW